MKQTENLIDQILKDQKDELNQIVIEALQNHLYSYICKELNEGWAGFCKELKQDIYKRIDIFLKEEGYCIEGNNK